VLNQEKMEDSLQIMKKKFGFALTTILKASIKLNASMAQATNMDTLLMT
jgi:hypothetical protein